MLYVVNYRGAQVQSGAPFAGARGDWVHFRGGGYACVTQGDGTVSDGDVRVAWPGDEGYVPPSPEYGSEVDVIDVSPDGKLVLAGGRREWLTRT